MFVEGWRLMGPADGNPKIDELRARVAADPGSRMFFPLAEELRKAGHLEEAERVLRGGIETHSSYLSAWVSLGRVMAALGRHGEAVVALNRALQLDPENVVAARLSAESYLAMGEKVEAIKKFKLVHAFIPSDQEIQAQIETLERQLNPEKYTREIKLAEEPPEFRTVTAETAFVETQAWDRYVEQESRDEPTPPPLPAGEGSGVRASLEDPFDGNGETTTYDDSSSHTEEYRAGQNSLTPGPSPAGRGEESPPGADPSDEEIVGEAMDSSSSSAPVLTIVRDEREQRQRTVAKLHRWLDLIQRSKRTDV